MDELINTVQPPTTQSQLEVISPTKKVVSLVVRIILILNFVFEIFWISQASKASNEAGVYAMALVLFSVVTTFVVMGFSVLLQITIIEKIIFGINLGILAIYFGYLGYLFLLVDVFLIAPIYLFIKGVTSKDNKYLAYSALTFLVAAVIIGLVSWILSI